MKNKPSSAIWVIGRGFPIWVQNVLRIPFLFILAWEALRAWLSAGKQQQNSCRSVSVVIPTRNEESHIEDCIRSVSKSPYVSEIIVVDAASADNTILLAIQAGARVITHNRPIENGGGRGGQIRAGVQAASGDVVAVVHADTRLMESDIQRIIEVLNQTPDIAGGAVGNRFDGDSRRFRWIELANHFRAGFLKISFGDQVQFFRRAPVVSRDLFPDIPIMEDVEFSIRLHRLGQVTYLFGNVVASTRRWENKGYRNALWVVKHVIVYLIRRLTAPPDTALIYRRYYGPFNQTARSPGPEM